MVKCFIDSKTVLAILAAGFFFAAGVDCQEAASYGMRSSQFNGVNWSAGSRQLIRTEVNKGSTTKIAFNQKLVPPQDDYITSGFGANVAISGDTAVVSSQQDQIGRTKKQGSVHVYVQREGVWIHQAKLIAADGKRQDQFGYKVAIDGDTIVVGVPAAAIGNDREQGAVYVFERQGDNWGRQVKLKASGGRKGDAFGSSVGISGNTIIVGATGVDNYPDKKYARRNGAAYIFERINNEWTEKQKITGDSEFTNLFGANVSIDDKTAAVSSILSDPGKAADAEVYIFSNSGTGWKKEHKISSKKYGAERPTGFGVSGNLAIDGNTLIIVGSDNTEKGGMSEHGALFVYLRDGGKWSQQAKLDLGKDEKDIYGWTADISGDNIIVGEHRPTPGQASAYHFTRNIADGKAVWVAQERIRPPGDELTAFFGSSVGISGKRILIGSAGLMIRRKNNKGAYVYHIGTPVP
ncbi:MAG: hypothetical protein KDB79_07505 [Acidobacteria bacterium]|nr:hypothetical protein [Acidobacteriota bacterium]